MDEEKNTQKPAASFTFLCKSCRLKIRVAKNQSGKKGRCPRCKNVLIIPSGQHSAPPAHQAQPTDTDPNRKDSLLDPNLFDIPKELKVSPVQPAKPYDPEDLDTLREQTRTVEPEPVVERQLPWFVDVFLYPTNRAGIISLVIFIGAPLFIDLSLRFLGLAASAFPPLILFVLFIGAIGGLLNLIIGLYLYWYFAECIRDSAVGGIRAPETMGTTPGLWELIGQIFEILGCLVFYFLPVLVYFIYTRKPDVVFWCLISYGVFFYPMGLLAVVMFDSFRALNPLLIISSIFSVFVQYVGLALLLLVFVYADIKVQAYVAESSSLTLIVHWIRIYLLMVAAHLVGRFYFKYQDKLNWEV